MKFDSRILKLIFGGMVVMVLLLSLISFLFPSTVVTVASEQMPVQREKIMEQLKNLNNWKNWNLMLKQNPTIIKGNTAMVNNGNKPYEIEVQSVDSIVVAFLIKRKGEKDIQNYLAINALADNAQLDVEWRTVTTLKWYPWEKFAGIFVGNISKPGMQASLAELKKFLTAR